MTVPAGDASLLYQQVILEHYRRPRNRGALGGATHQGTASNPVCGDEVVVQVRMRDEVIEAVMFSGRGCAISQAAASLMTGALTGRTLEAGAALREAFGAMMRGDSEAERDVMLGSLRGLAGIGRFPARIRCALLPWEAVEAAVGTSRLSGRSPSRGCSRDR